MYYVIETQTNKDGTGTVTPVITKTNRNEAESEFHRILQYAAISPMYKHGAIVVDEDDYPIMYQCYKHDTEDE